MGDRTVSTIVDEVSTAIWDTMHPLYIPQPTTEMWETISPRFEERWRFPHCIGALDGKHVTFSGFCVVVSAGVTPSGSTLYGSLAAHASCCKPRHVNNQ